jgi:phage terminase large subunit-like protein
MVDPETDAPYRLLPAEKLFLKHAFKTDRHGRALYPEQLYSCPKKSGKTAFGAMHLLTTVLLFGGRHAEAICAANDLDQSTGRVFEAVRKIIDCSPALRSEAKIAANKITLSTGAVITAIASDYASAAGANQNISVFDEVWAYTSERSRRLWDEMIPPPTRKIALRLSVTYTGFEGESTLLEELCKRGLQQPEIGPYLHAGDGLLMFWSHETIAPWQSAEWVESMRRSLRPNQFMRMIENRFVTTENAFVDMDWWDACTDPALVPELADKMLPVWVGVDASVKKDSTAVVAVTFDSKSQRLRLIAHRVFQPTATQPLDFEATIEATVKEYCRRFAVRGVHFDPYQMQAVAQRLRTIGVPMREFPQSVPNLTAMGSNLHEIIKGARITVYRDDALRLAISRTVAKETPRGLQLMKEKQSHKIDVVIALAMAALHAVEQGAFEDSVIAEPIVVCAPYAYSPGGFAGGMDAPHLDVMKVGWPTW